MILIKINNSAITTCLLLSAINLNTVLVSAECNIEGEPELNLEADNELNLEVDNEFNETSKFYPEIEIIDLNKKNSTSNNIENVRKKFKQFYIYGPMSNPTIDLSDSNSLIKTHSQANNILRTSKDGKKTDRQLFLDAWNSLSNKEKASKEMKQIDTSYKNIISITNAAKSVLKFYEDVKENKDTFIKDSSKANKLNSKSNKALGARGKAYDDYIKATKIESKASSKRVKYLNEKYLDTVYFLNVSKYIVEKNRDKAITEMSKIKDKTLKTSASNAIEVSFVNAKQEAVINKFKQFYLYGPMSNPTIDLSDKNSLIKKYSQVEGLLKTTDEDGVIYDRQKFLDAYNKLSKSEKEHPKMKEIKAEFDKMITILEAAKSVLKFYEDVKGNAKDLIANPTKSNELNSTENLKLGARGRAYNDYMNATKVEPSKNSKRMSYLNQKYCDTLYFLSIPKYIKAKNSDKALELVDKIDDSTLKKVAIDAIYDAKDSNFEITPNSPTFKNNMMNRPSYNENTKHYYLIRSYLEELDSRGGGTLTLKGGTYNISNVLYVPSNTTIILDGATLKKINNTGGSSLVPSKSIFQLISPSNKSDGVKFGEYDGEHNIKIIGKNKATIDLNFIPDSLGIIIGHNNNIEVTGINFINMNGGHFIELDASKDVTIKSNVFKGSVAYGNLSKEAINIDTPDKLTEGWDSTWTKYDKTPNFNIFIENNLFSNLDRAIGTHKYSQGKYHTNIYIRNNTIEKTRSDSIRIMNWKDTVIENNIIRDINSTKSNVRGILASGAINPTIKKNTFINMPRAMQFSPTKNNGAGSGYEITYNDLNWRNKNDLADNTIKNVGEDFIRVNEEYDIFTNPERIYFFVNPL